jgi:hypothetical protein
VSFATWTTPELCRAVELIAAELEKAAPLQPADYEAKYWALRQRTRAKVQRYARRVAASKWSGSQFRDAMNRTLRSTYTEAFRYGAGSVVGRTILSDADRLSIAEQLGDDLMYLERFAAQIPGADYSEDYLVNRAAMYGDSLHSVYWAGRVSRFENDSVWRWVAMDDGRTCRSCAALSDRIFTTWSLPGYPGSVCAGGGRCRCSLVLVDTDSLSSTEMADLGLAA